MTLDPGTVVLVELDPTVGHEQRGVRPYIAVSDPSVNSSRSHSGDGVVAANDFGVQVRTMNPRSVQ